MASEWTLAVGVVRRAFVHSNSLVGWLPVHAAAGSRVELLAVISLHCDTVTAIGSVPSTDMWPAVARAPLK